MTNRINLQNQFPNKGDFRAVYYGQIFNTRQNYNQFSNLCKFINRELNIKNEDFINLSDENIIDFLEIEQDNLKMFYFLTEKGDLFLKNPTEKVKINLNNNQIKYLKQVQFDSVIKIYLFSESNLFILDPKKSAIEKSISIQMEQCNNDSQQNAKQNVQALYFAPNFYKICDRKKLVKQLINNEQNQIEDQKEYTKNQIITLEKEIKMIFQSPIEKFLFILHEKSLSIYNSINLTLIQTFETEIKDQIFLSFHVNNEKSVILISLVNQKIIIQEYLFEVKRKILINEETLMENWHFSHNPNFINILNYIHYNIIQVEDLVFQYQHSISYLEKIKRTSSILNQSQITSSFIHKISQNSLLTLSKQGILYNQTLRIQEPQIECLYDSNYSTPANLNELIQLQIQMITNQYFDSEFNTLLLKPFQTLKINSILEISLLESANSQSFFSIFNQFFVIIFIALIGIALYLFLKKKQDALKTQNNQIDSDNKTTKNSYNQINSDIQSIEVQNL